MKYFSDYIQDAQSAALKEAGAFFAFSQEQYDDQKKHGVVYVNLGVGLICPRDRRDALVTTLNNIAAKGRAADIAENGREAVILRELYNYECFYVWDIQDAVEALKDYGISRDEVATVFKANAEAAEAIMA